MLIYIAKRIVYTLPIMLGVTLVCFALVHLAPGDPLVSVLPPDASRGHEAADDGAVRLRSALLRAVPALALAGACMATSARPSPASRPVVTEVSKAVGNTLMLAAVATMIGFALGTFFGFVAGYFRDTFIDKLASFISVIGVSVPHYWLGMVLVIIFAATLGWLPPTGAGPGGSGAWRWNWEHTRHLILPAVTMSVIPMGIIARTVRALVAEILSQEFIVGLRAKGLNDLGIFRHVVKNTAPTALAVMGIQLGYLLGGSILIETVFSWPGTGFAAERRHLPARPAAAAGDHPGAGAVLRDAQPRGRRRADGARSPHPEELSAC